MDIFYIHVYIISLILYWHVKIVIWNTYIYMYLYISVQVDIYYISLCFASSSRFAFFFCYLLGFISPSCPEYEHVNVWKGIFQLPSCILLWDATWSLYSSIRKCSTASELCNVINYHSLTIYRIHSGYLNSLHNLPPWRLSVTVCFVNNWVCSVWILI